MYGKPAVPKSAPDFFSNRTFLFITIIFLILNVSVVGCARRLLPQNRVRRPLLENLSSKNENSQEGEKDYVQTRADLLFFTKGKVESLQVAANSKRLLVERKFEDNFVDNTEDKESISFVKSFGKEPPDFFEENQNDKIGVELWNIDFSEARQENIYGSNLILTSFGEGRTRFNEEGERLFWIERESGKSLSQNRNSINDSLIIRGNEFAFDENLSDVIRNNTLNEATSRSKNTSADIVTGFAGYDSYGEETVPSFPNVVKTKLLEDQWYNREIALTSTLMDEVKHLKIPNEIRSAQNVFLSSQARWAVCELSEASDSNSLESIDPNWALVLLRERERVVRFPARVKLTFDNTDAETVEGRIVDVLDVSDVGDLVATLVEERLANETTDSFETGLESSRTTSLNSPRYKIVVWDLKVVREVDLSQAKKPLTALEVSQINIPYPISRRYCKFSPNGERFAARVEPRYISIWQSANGRLFMELGEHSGVVRDFNFSPRSSKLIVGVDGTKAQVVLWEIRKGVIYRTLDDVVDGASSIDAVAFAPDESFVYFANDLGEVKRWNIRSQRGSVEE